MVFCMGATKTKEIRYYCFVVSELLMPPHIYGSRLDRSRNLLLAFLRDDGSGNDYRGKIKQLLPATFVIFVSIRYFILTLNILANIEKLI